MDLACSTVHGRYFVIISAVVHPFGAMLQLIDTKMIDFPIAHPGVLNGIQIEHSLHVGSSVVLLQQVHRVLVQLAEARLRLGQKGGRMLMSL